MISPKGFTGVNATYDIKSHISPDLLLLIPRGPTPHPLGNASYESRLCVGKNPRAKGYVCRSEKTGSFQREVKKFKKI